MPYIKKTIDCGRVMEIYKYKELPRGIKAAEETRPSTEEQQAANRKRSENRLTRMLRCNFCRENGDRLLTYTHEQDLTEAQAMREGRNLKDRLKRLRKRLGLPELKAIVVTEKQGKWHHHVIMNGGLSLEQMEQVWNIPKSQEGSETGWKQYRGGVNVRSLDGPETFIRLARYMLAEEKDKRGKPEAGNVKEERPKGSRRWNATKNLTKPKVRVQDIKPPKPVPPKAPKGYVLIEDESFCKWDGYGNVYIKIVCYKAVWPGDGQKGRVRKHDTVAKEGAKVLGSGGMVGKHAGGAGGGRR